LFVGPPTVAGSYFKEVRAGNGWWANKQAWQAGFN